MSKEFWVFESRLAGGGVVGGATAVAISAVTGLNSVLAGAMLGIGLTSIGLVPGGLAHLRLSHGMTVRSMARDVDDFSIQHAAAHPENEYSRMRADAVMKRRR